MAALATALERILGRRRRLAITATAVAAVAIAGGVAFAAVGSEPTVTAREAAPCTGAERELVGVWDPPRRAAVSARFAATDVAYAGESWERVAAALDRDAADWVRSHRAACEATQV